MALYEIDPFGGHSGVRGPRRPSGIPRLNPASPLRRSLVGSWANAGTTALVPVGFPSLAFTLAGTPTVGASASTGTGTVFDGSSVEGQLAVPASDSGSQVTVAAWVSLPTSVVRYSRILEKGANTAWTLGVDEGGADQSKFSWVVRPGGAVTLATTNQYGGTGPHLVVARAILSSGAQSLIIDGGSESLSTTSASGASFDTSDIFFGKYGGGGFRAPMTLFTLNIWARSLSDHEVWSLWAPRTRWDLYWQPSRRTYAFVGAAAPAARANRLAMLGVS